MEADVVSRNKVIENDMYALCEKLFPICRSITGNGVRETLSVLNSVMGGISRSVRCLQVRECLIGLFRKNGI